ncbi:MAG: transposase [Treponema sp.]|nr:transposase [Treponema sp.]
MFSLAPEQLQMNLPEAIQYVNELPTKEPTKFIKLLKEHIDLPTLIPNSFYSAYYSSETNQRDYLLESLVAILLLMQFFKFANISNFVTLLVFSPEICKFCRLPVGSIPDESVISKFKIKFENQLKLFFENLTLPVIDIFDDYDDSLPENSPDKGKNRIEIYDTTGLKPKVKENNPKYLQTEIKKQTSYKKFLESQGKGEKFNAHSAAYKNMSKQANANEAIRLCYSNGHFGYFYKYGKVTNGFGIPLHIHFLDKEFYDTQPKDFDTVEDQKYTFDNASLCPVLSAFHNRVGHGRFTTFLGDSEFDSYDNYGFLQELGFEKVLIPINDRNTPLTNTPVPVNSSGIPCCPKDNSRSFIPDGKCKGKNRSLRYKFVCPKSRRVNNKWQSDCEDKCRKTNSTVTTYTYPSSELRNYFGVHRGSKEWVETYKIRTIIERGFSSEKSHPALSHPNTYNSATLRADVYINAASKLITVMLAFALGKPEFMRNLKSLLKSVA